MGNIEMQFTSQTFCEDCALKDIFKGQLLTNVWINVYPNHVFNIFSSMVMTYLKFQFYYNRNVDKLPS